MAKTGVPRAEAFHATDQAQVFLCTVQKRRKAGRQARKALLAEWYQRGMLRVAVEEAIAAIGIGVAKTRIERCAV